METRIVRPATVLFAAVLLLALAACGNRERLHIAREGLERVEIETHPALPEYSRIYTQQEDMDSVAAYLEGLRLERDFPEDPNHYTGMSYSITLHYEDGGAVEYSHFGNLFLRADGGEGLKMDCQEAAELDALIRAWSGKEQ